MASRRAAGTSAESGEQGRGGLRFAPLTSERWQDFERLFGPRGACGGCWCMEPRCTRAEYEANKGDGNRRAMRRLVDAGPPPGVLGYLGDEAIAWCAVEPRARFGKLARSRVLAPVDARQVWAIACLFVQREQRGRGVSVAMIEAAVAHARSQGADCVEAYPVDPKKKPMPAAFAFPGPLAAYLRAGFVEVARRSSTRPIVRRELGRRR